MGRHGYTDDCDDEDNTWGLWRGTIKSAVRGRRGQAFFRALVDALDAMPKKELVAEVLETQDGEVCALGCLGKARGADMTGVDSEDYDQLGKMFDVAPCLTQEVMWRNDEAGYMNCDPATRWAIVRDWAARQIVPGTDAKGGADG